MPDPSPSLRIATIICAAGSGTRFGGGQISKLDADIHGRPVLIRAVEALSGEPEISQVIVAGPADPQALALFRQTHQRTLDTLNAEICPGGVAERYETVKAALEYLVTTTSPADLPHAVLVHDAARPCTPRHVVAAVIEALRTHGAVVPAVPISDTIKRAHAPETADPTSPSGTSTKTPDESRILATVDQTTDRRGLFACQTPQGFHLKLLRRAYDQKDLASTDDAQLIERLGEQVILVPGDPRNLKITRPADLEVARALWPMTNSRSPGNSPG